MSNHCHNSYNTRLIHQEPSWVGEKLAVTLVTWTRGIYTPLKLAIPPLTAQRSFACSVSSLSQSPRHYLPGHHCFRGDDPAGCCLGQYKPSTWSAALRTVPSTAASHPLLGTFPDSRPQVRASESSSGQRGQVGQWLGWGV